MLDLRDNKYTKKDQKEEYEKNMIKTIIKNFLRVIWKKRYWSNVSRKRDTNNAGHERFCLQNHSVLDDLIIFSHS
jgi:hypothetical protein